MDLFHIVATNPTKVFCMLRVDLHVCTIATRGVPNFTINATLEYLEGDMDETLSVLCRRLLVHLCKGAQ